MGLGGVWEWVTSTTTTVRNNTPDLKVACRKTYDVGRAALHLDGGVVVAKSRDAYHYLSNDEVRDVAKNISKHSALYLLRSYGGGPVIDIVSRSLQDKKTDPQKARLDALETKLAKLEKELNLRKIHEQVENEEASIRIAPRVQCEPDLDANMNQTPEDLLQNFMMKQFVGTKLLDDLFVPIAGSRMKEKQVPVSND